MTITRTASPASGSLDGLSVRGQRHGLRTVLLVGIAVLVLAVIAGWALVSATSHSSQPASVTSDANPYAAGGSVYGEQVPPEAANANPYKPGGSVYGEQVPWQAEVSANPYAPGGSVYREQVPAATAQ